MGFLGGSDGREYTCNAGDPDLIPGWGRSPEEEKGNSLQYPSLEDPMYRGALPATVRGVAKSDTTEQRTLSIFMIKLILFAW